ncbi:MAG TPA: hypothetical protein VL481_00840 [Verrucomicrobiae bacterium]|jgi:hypothetical protein|nr:hypothetical protein [Verrucomicrobiae bacterium]
MSRKERTPYIDALRVISNAPPAGAAPAQEQKPSVDNRILEEEVRLARIENDIREKDQALKEQTLRWLFILLGIETGIVFIIAVMQGFHLGGFALDEWSLRLLLAATLVQTVSMLTIAIRHLFPQQKQ